VGAFARAFGTGLVVVVLEADAFTDLGAAILRAGRPRLAAGCSVPSSVALRLVTVALVGADVAAALVLELVLDAIGGPAATAFFGGMIGLERVECDV